MLLIVDADSIRKHFALDDKLFETILLRLVHKIKMLHFPEETTILSSQLLHNINGVHHCTDPKKVVETFGVAEGDIILSADPYLLGLSYYKLQCYEPSDTWIDPEEITHGRLKKRLGYEPRDHYEILNTTDPIDKKVLGAIGRTRKERWKWAEVPRVSSGGYIKASENIHVKVGRVGFQNYTVVQDVPEFARQLEQVDTLGWDTETTGLDWMEDWIVGESFSFDGKHGYYLPMTHTNLGGQYVNNNPQQVYDLIHPLLNKRALRGANLGFDVLFGCQYGLGFPRQLYDVQGYGYMLGLHVPDPSKLGLKALSRDRLDDVMEEYAAVSGGAPFNEVPIDRAAPYAADDAVKSYRLIDNMTLDLDASQLTRYQEIYMKLLYTCIRMSYNGMYLDMSELTPLLATLEFERDMVRSRIIAYAGYPINTNSVPQMQKLLFEDLGLTLTPLTKSGKPSTGSDHLERISHEHPVVADIINYRELSKLIDTYLVGYQGFIKADHRIHSSLNPFKVITGRLSSTNPNLMNIPVRGDRGAMVRKLFSAQGDNMLLSCDASQLEYRVLAHYTNNPDLVATFSDPSRDIHRTMASIIFDKPEADVNKQDRDIAKTVFYAILYGAAAPRIARELNINVGYAVTIIKAIQERIPEIDLLRKQVIHDAINKGYVESYGGHRSYSYGLFSRNSAERESAERSAFDALFQGTGSGDITALATIRTQELLDSMGYNELDPEVRLVQQIHDELLLEGPEELLEIIGPQVSDIFSNAVTGLRVPIVAGYQIGKKWGDIH